MPTTTLPTELTEILTPVFRALPMERALNKAVVAAPIGGQAADAVKTLIASGKIADKSALAAGLWLYVDDLNASHVISQGFEGTPTFDFWHCIMHRLEGDFSNSHYWLRRAGKHPAMANVPGGYDAGKLIDAAEAAEKAGKMPEDVVALQRAEWTTLMAWCWANRK